METPGSTQKERQEDYEERTKVGQRRGKVA